MQRFMAATVVIVLVVFVLTALATVGSGYLRGMDNSNIAGYTWEVIARYPSGDDVIVKIQKTPDSVSDISWALPKNHPFSVLKKGEIVRFERIGGAYCKHISDCLKVAEHHFPK